MNRYFTPTVFKPELYAPPVAQISQALELAQRQYDTNFLAAQELKNQYIESLQQDRARANEIQASIEKKVDDVVSKYGGQYNRASKDLYLLKQELNKDFNPGGEAYAIAANKKMWDEQVKYERARAAKGEITQKQFDMWYNYNMNTYTGVGKKDPITDSYNMLNPDIIASAFDDAKFFNEVESKIPERTTKVPTKIRRDNYGLLYYEEKEVKYKDPNEVASAFNTQLQSDPEYQAYINQMSKWMGISPLAYHDALVNDYIQNVIPARTGTIDDKITPHYITDPGYAEALRFEYWKKKRKIEGEEDAANQTRLSVLSVGKNANSLYKKYDFENKVSIPSVGGMFGLSYDKKTGGVKSVATMLKDRNDPAINYPLLEATYKGNQGRPDRDIWMLYNDVVENGDHFGRSTYQYEYATEDSRYADMQRIYPAVLSGNTPIYKLDPNTGDFVPITSASQRRSIAQSWADDRNKITARATGKVSAQTGTVPYGTTVTDIDGNVYAVPESSVEFKDYNFGTGTPGSSMRERLFGFMQDPTKLGVGDVTMFYGQKDGKAVPMYVRGRTEYEWSEGFKTAIPQARYYSTYDYNAAQTDEIFKSDNLIMTEIAPGVSIPADPIDMEQRAIGHLMRGSLPRQAKSRSKETDTTYENSFNFD